MPIQQTTPNTIQAEDLEPQGKKQKGTGFTNIGNILKANVGAGERMGSTIGQSLGTQAGQAKQSARKNVAAFQEQVGQKTKEALQPAERAAQLTSGLTPASAITGSGANLVGLSETEAEEIGKGLQKAKSGEAYTGPTTFADAGTLASQAQNVKQLGTLGMGGSLGQRELIRSLAAKQGPYTRGQSILDATLLGQSEAGQRAIRGGAQQAMEAGQNIGRQAALADIVAKGATSSVKEEAAKKLQDLTKLGGDIGGAAKQQAADYLSGAQRLSDIATGKIKAGYKTDLEGKQVFDQAQYDKDLALRDMMGEYGLGGLGNVSVDIGSANFQNLLRSVFDPTQATPAGDVYYKGDQRKIAENLARMTGATPSDIKAITETPFIKERFAGDVEDITKGKHKGLYEATQDEANKLRSQQSQYQNILDNYKKMFTRLPYSATIDADMARDPNLGYDAGIRGAFVNEARRVLGDEAVDQSRNYFYNKTKTSVAEDIMDFFGGGSSAEMSEGEAEAAYLKDVYNAIQNRMDTTVGGLKNVAQRTTTLQDYLNSLITGQAPESSGQTGVPGLNLVRRPGPGLR
jgi:hypothetical protein